MVNNTFNTGDLIQLIDGSYVVITFPSDEPMTTESNWLVDCVPSDDRGEPVQEGDTYGTPHRTEYFDTNLGRAPYFIAE